MEKQRGIRFGITEKLLVYFLLLSLVPIVIVGSISFIVARNQLEKKTEVHLAHLARDCGRKISFYVNSHYQDIKLLSRTDIFKGNETDAKQEYIREVIKVYPYCDAISVIDLNGTIIACTREDFVGESRADETWFQRTLQCKNDDVTILDVYRAETAGHDMVIGFNAPITDESNKEVIGVLATRVSTEHIVKRIQLLDEKTSGGNHAYLLNKKGEILAGPEEKEFLNIYRLHEFLVVKDLIAGKTGISRYKNDREEDVISARYVLKGDGDFDGWGWGVITTAPVSEAFKAAYIIRNTVVALLLVIALLVAVFAVYISRGFSRPIMRVSESALQIAQGDLKATEIKYGPKDEIGDLVGAFNKMTENLQETTVSRDSLAKEIDERKRAEEELAKHREHLEELIRERTERTAELEKRVSEVEQLNSAMVNLMEDLRVSNESLKTTTHQLANANKELEAFSYSVSHDLRAPLRSVDGFSQILLEDYSDTLDEKGKHYLERARAGTQKMGQLIDDILNFSRIGRQAMKMKKINMESIAREVYNSLEDEWKERKVDFNVHKCPSALSDLNLMQIVFTNLLSNALKFTRKREEAKIEVGSETKDKQTVFFVKDNGVGFNMKYVDKLFTPFQRLHRVEEYEGTGIGLAIVQRIIHRHGGRIWVESEPDVGTTFYFTV